MTANTVGTRMHYNQSDPATCANRSGVGDQTNLTRLIGTMLDHKQCKLCGESKPLTEFSPISKKNRPGQLRTICKPCNSERMMTWRDNNREKDLDTRLKRKYGITLAEYRVMEEAQGGVCAICGEPPTIINWEPTRRQGKAVDPRLVVDHDHVTGENRGLLCSLCNRGIGFLGDDPDRVRSALAYLEGGP